jgi:hypothetical protein
MATISERLREPHHMDKLDAEAADVIDAIVVALEEVRGYSADVAAVNMLKGEDAAETHNRVGAHGRALLKIIDAALALARKGD